MLLSSGDAAFPPTYRYLSTYLATIGRLEDESLFYLRSRGIGEAEAMALLTRGFAAQITDRIASAALRERIESLALARLFEAEPRR